MTTAPPASAPLLVPRESSGPLASSSLVLRSSSEWLDYFRRNADQLLPIPWEHGPELTDKERESIAASVQGFQLGESSEGRHLAKCARDYAQSSGDVEYYPAIQLFIREEQRHARELGRFMERSGIPMIRKTWPDTVFRRLRHLASLEQSIGVLVTAEIIAKVYYPALREAACSGILQAICEQIIRDEAPHVEFQCERLAILRRQCSTPGLVLRHGLHRVLFFGTIFVVWMKHGRALRAGHYGFWRLWSTCWTEFADARRRMDPRSYTKAENAALVLR